MEKPLRLSFGISAPETVNGKRRSLPGRARQSILTGEAAILLHLVTIDCKVSSIFNRSAILLRA
jgi:hypothetical protein